MTGHGSKARLWETAVAALLSEPSLESAAQKTGISLKTLKSWLKHPGFQTLWHQARNLVLESAAGQIAAAAGEAVQTLREALKSDRASDRTRAALGILQLAMRERGPAEPDASKKGVPVILQIKEEVLVVGLTPPLSLDNIREEIVTNDGSGRANGEAPPGPAGLPPV
jgi:hypothetical protein